MQAAVVDSVMRRIENNMAAYDTRITETIAGVVEDLNQKFNDSQSTLTGSITSLEKYLTDVHAQ